MRLTLHILGGLTCAIIFDLLLVFVLPIVPPYRTVTGLTLGFINGMMWYNSYMKDAK